MFKFSTKTLNFFFNFFLLLFFALNIKVSNFF